MELTDPILQTEDETNINKYKMAGKIATDVLDQLVKICKPGTSVYQMCRKGDISILKELESVYTDIKNKGICFPTSISINNVAGYFSPKPDDNTIINDGDLVKIEIGVHIDGFPALITYTVVVNESYRVIEDKKANVVKAVAEASREILKVMRPGKKNTDVVKIMEKCAQKYGCNLPVILENIHAPGVMSYQMSQYVLDDYNDDSDDYIHRLILCKHNDNYNFTLREDELEENAVYGIDILMSSGSGKLHRSSYDATIFKRVVSSRVNLKLKTSRTTLNKFKNYPFPINVNNHMDARFKLGLKECIDKGLIDPYYPVQDRSGEYVARTKFTVIVKNKPILITGRSADEQLYKLISK